MSDLTQQFVDVITKWRSADSQRMIFGIDMPQTQRAISELTESLQKTLVEFKEFSLVEKNQKMEIVVKNGDDSTMQHIPINLPALPKVLTDLKINSITLSTGVKEEELKELFNGISMKPEDIEQQGGLKGILQEKGVSSIKVDQMKFQLLKDEEHVTTAQENNVGISKETKKATKKETAEVKKLRDSVWKDYLSEKLTQKDFKEKHEDFLVRTLEEPKLLEKTLKRMISKQEKVEEFLALLEEKLFNVGFSREDVESLKKKLLTPKKVLVAEDELARLRKIEKEFQSNVDQRMDNTLETINTIKKKLSDQTERSEAILHQMSQGGITLDKNGNIVSVNSTAQNILGASQKDMSGKSIKDAVTDHHLLTMVSDWQNETDSHTPKEVKVHASDEETLSIIRESAIVVQDEDGHSIGVISSLQSVTQQDELKKRKNDILDVLGHDLRAPLCAIKQNFEVLLEVTDLEVEDDSKQGRFLDNCKRNIVRMEKLISKILDMRQLETGKILVKYDVIETNNLLEDVVTSVDSWAKNKNIHMEINAQKLPNIDGDPERLYQVIANFLSNALKFTPEEGNITVSGEALESEGRQWVKISVKDSGMGIKKEDIGRIFNKYEQVSQNTTSGISGLGLGLSICKTIIDLHGGRVWAESEPEFGSTFSFQIPVVKVKEE